MSIKHWAILITAAIHGVMLVWFASHKIKFDPEKEWTQMRMSFQEEPIETPKEKEELIIPDNYQEHGLDQRKYSVAKTNEAINEATSELSKGEKARLEKEIEAQVSNMAKEASTTGFLESKSTSDRQGKLPAKGQKEVTKIENKGSEKGKADLGNAHNESTNISYYLKNRAVGPIGLYNPVYLCQSGGKVVVNIVVNRSGNVISASINDSKSGTKNPCLREAAKKAAERSTFNEDLSADARQRGIITYNFVNQ